MNTEKEEEQERDKIPTTVPVTEDVESGESLTFEPRVYIQRYLTIANLLNEDRWRRTITSVADFGCSDFKLFKFLKSLNYLERICGVDIDETLMNRCKYAAQPLVYEYLSHYNRNLTVDLFVGSIAEPDSRLVGIDAVICIELIEHLYPETLEKVPYTVFECLRPKLAVFTTPNSDFNVLFKLKGFRHYDHKFEWSRKEFEDWCHTLLRKYNNYEVYFEGIGTGPEGTDHLGCVSQMAVFTRRDDHENLEFETVTATPYKLFSQIVYPFKKDERSDEQKLSDEIKYSINKVITMTSLYAHCQTYEGYEIPINLLWDDRMKKFFSDEQALKEKLLEFRYDIALNDDGVDVVKVPEDDESSDSYDSEDYSTSDCDLTLNVATIDDVEENWE